MIRHWSRRLLGCWLVAVGPLAAMSYAQAPQERVASATAGPTFDLQPFDLQPLSAEIAAMVEAFVKANEIPGLSVAMAVGAGPKAVLRAQGFGLADMENDVPATPATVYRLASISKPITAVCVLQLVDAGRLDLDTDIADYLEEWRGKRWPVTCRQVLAHLGGVRHYKRREGESTRAYANQRAALERFSGDPLLHEPGTTYRYSTFGYNLLAAVVEARAQVDFAEYVRRHVSQPSGAASLQDDSVARLIRHRAQGYVRVGQTLRNSRLMDASYKLGGGGLCCSAPDLVRFGRTLLSGKLCSAESLQAMTTRARKADGSEIGYGLGLSVAADRSEYWHGGAQSRVSTVLLLRPKAPCVVAVLCNLERMRLLPLARRIADHVEQSK